MGKRKRLEGIGIVDVVVKEVGGKRREGERVGWGGWKVGFREGVLGWRLWRIGWGRVMGVGVGGWRLCIW